ncbi:MAG: hypothetical protein EXR00_07775 [Alphaproteobacteria bacterium]|nr:hypothetical protein [Alphaproteobacteria bacterium]
MTELKLSNLETIILRTFHETYSNLGFPPPENIAVRRRENTGAGRYVDLASADTLTIEDGYLDLAGRYIRMSGVPNGLMAVVAIQHGKLDQLEIATYGDVSWDGEERTWAII